MFILIFGGANGIPANELCFQTGILIGQDSIAKDSENYILSKLADYNYFKKSGKLSVTYTNLIESASWAINILNDNQKKLLKESIEFLYLDFENKIISEIYQNYKQAIIKLEKLNEELSQTQDEDIIADLKTQIEELENDLDIKYQRSKIKSYEMIISKYNIPPSSIKNIYLSQLESYKTEHSDGTFYHKVNSDVELIDIITRSEGWESTLIPVNKIYVIKNNNISSPIPCDSTYNSTISIESEINLPTGANLSYKHKDIFITLPWLELGFFMLDTWYLKDRSHVGIVSDNNPKNDFTSNEILPAIPVKITIAKDSILQTKLSREIIKKIFSEHESGNTIAVENIAFSGDTFLAKDKQKPTINNNLLQMHLPQVIKISLESTHLSPNPSNNYEW